MTRFIPQDPKSRITAAAAVAVVFGGLYALSRTLMQNVYLFEWTARNLYFFFWIPALVLALFGKTVISNAITFGNLAGVIIGQLLGDFIVSQNAKLITPDTTPDREYLLLSHPGSFIWIITVLVFAAVGIVLQIVSSSRKSAA